MFHSAPSTLLGSEDAAVNKTGEKLGSYPMDEEP
jgi:hypothetical protein